MPTKAACPKYHHHGTPLFRYVLGCSHCGTLAFKATRTKSALAAAKEHRTAYEAIFGETDHIVNVIDSVDGTIITEGE